FFSFPPVASARPSLRFRSCFHSTFASFPLFASARLSPRFRYRFHLAFAPFPLQLPLGSRLASAPLGGALFNSAESGAKVRQDFLLSKFFGIFFFKKL
ncbi:MAG: hypothetical protein J1E33_03255, partial [Alistipes sp.]|nr:hypothetical protein [Alistipes sp.]